MLSFLLIEHDGENIVNNIKALQKKSLNVLIATTNIPNWLLELIPEKNILMTDTFNSVSLPIEVEAFTETCGIKLNAIGTFSEDNVTQTADLAAAFGLIGIPPYAARRSSNNKLLMRRFCKEAGIKTPNYRIVPRMDLSQLKKAINEVGLPCVVKPAAFGSRSCGTVKIESGSDLNEVVEKIKVTTTPNTKESFKNYNGTLIVEEYIDGRVISIDGIIKDGIISIFGSVEYTMGPEPWFTQEAYKIPAFLTYVQRTKAETLAKKIVKVLGFDNCAFHCEQKITTNGPMLLEIAARLPGGRIPTIYELATGTDPLSFLIDLLLGEKITVPKSVYKKHVVEKPVYPSKSGRLTKLDGIEEAKNMKDVWFFKVNEKVGQTVVTYPHIPRAIYFYGLEADTDQELKNKMSELESKINIVIE